MHFNPNIRGLQLGGCVDEVSLSSAVLSVFMCLYMWRNVYRLHHVHRFCSFTLLYIQDVQTCTYC